MGMKALKNVWTKELLREAHGSYKGQFEYDFILSLLPGAIKIQEDQGSYDGDSLCLYKLGDCSGYDDNATFAVLHFGWGSCSACDPLQAASDWDDFADLLQSLYDSMRWFDDLGKA